MSLSPWLPASQADLASTTLPSQGRARPGHHPYGPPEEDPGQHSDHEGPADQHPGAPPAPLTRPLRPQVMPAIGGLAGLASGQGGPRLVLLSLAAFLPGTSEAEDSPTGSESSGSGRLKGTVGASTAGTPGPRAEGLLCPRRWSLNATEPHRDVDQLPSVCTHTCAPVLYGVCCYKVMDCVHVCPPARSQHGCVPVRAHRLLH